MKKISIYLNIVLISIVFILVEGIMTYQKVIEVKDSQIRIYQQKQEYRYYKQKEINDYAIQISQKNSFLEWKECIYFADYILYLIDNSYRDKYIHPNLIINLITVESTWRVGASTSVAYGLMQINYSTWYKKYYIPHPSYLYDPFYNIKIGIDIFANYYNKTKNLKKALVLYSGNTTSKHYYEYVIRGERKLNEK